MEKVVYTESIVAEIADNILDLITRGLINEDRSILIYGMDVFSFAINSILKNHGIGTESYLLQDFLQARKLRRRIKAAGRYIRSDRDTIGAISFEELQHKRENTIILIASKEYDQIKVNLISNEYKENVDFFCLYDWTKDEYKDYVSDKKRICLKEMQKIEKDILKRIDTFCIDNEITYWVCGGTLLGTIRHKGFIPWDDDMDIFMPLQDYNRFIEEFKDPQYSLMGHGVTKRKDYFGLYIKVIDNHTTAREDYDFLRETHPLGVDIFPLIGLPNDDNDRKRFFEDYYELVYTIREDYYSRDGDMGVYDEWDEKQSSYLYKYDFDLQDYVGVIDTGYKERDCAHKSVYSTTLRMHFEDIEVNVPVGYEEYLTNLYGDWRKLPPENERQSHHNMEAYYL